MKKKTRAPTLLEQLIARETAETLTASTSLAIRKVAEDIAREALEAPGFREAIRTLVSERMQALLDELTRARP